MGDWCSQSERELTSSEVALEREVEGDLFLHDIGQGFGFRPGTFDGCISYVHSSHPYSSSLSHSDSPDPALVYQSSNGSSTQTPPLIPHNSVSSASSPPSTPRSRTPPVPYSNSTHPRTTKCT